MFRDDVEVERAKTEAFPEESIFGVYDSANVCYDLEFSDGTLITEAKLKHFVNNRRNPGRL